MDKKEFQNMFKIYMRSKGFRVRGNCAYQFIDDQYVIGVYLDHHPFVKAYFVEYGAIYEPDSTQRKKILSGKSDFRMCFQFTVDPSDDLDHYQIEDLSRYFDRSVVIDWFDYTIGTKEYFEKSMEVNFKKRLNALYDKEYVLELYRKDWIQFRKIPYDTVYKIARLAGLDANEVIRFRDRS